ncbi:MAG: asparagine synthase (glutamine-hydrolyzing) [Acidobacteria bacterium]|nr:asparagine synthase (glutamine-hydrolyzing) [Acidobacteriota bacterium]
MCGIAGYCGPASRFNEERLRTILRAIEHRGPDDQGLYTAPVPGVDHSGPDARLWLGSCRLAIQDLTPAGHQPMVDAATGNAIAFNGEIYNFLELRAKLEHSGSPFQSRCDTEVALRSWCAQGLKALDEWRGMFAAAIWDACRQELWLVRDQWGIKPLYYRWDGEGVAFCSEVHGLLAGGVAPRQLSRRGLEDFLRFGAAQDPVTIIDGVYALLPGHALRWSQGKIEIRRYGEQPGQGDGGGEGLAPGAVETMLREIVRQQLISDVPVAVFLSGGVDSSVVAALARQEAGAGVNTVSVVFEEDRYSERRYARRIAAHIGTRHHEVLLRGGEARAKAVEAISRMDQPTIDGINTYVVCEAARRAGFTVALSGLGGDEFFGGYSTFRRTSRLRRMQQVAQRAPALAGWAAGKLRSGFGPAANQLGRYLESGDFWEHPYFLQRTVFFPQQVEALCRGGVASAEADRLAEARRQGLAEEAARLDPLNQVSLLEARTYMANMLLRDSDQMSMAHSLELRVPLVDQRLAACLLAVPGERKGFGRSPKLWLRQAFAPYLPPEVFTRKEMGCTLPFAVWLKSDLRREVEETLGRNPGGLWSPPAVNEVWEDFWEGKVGWSRPWALYVLSRWTAEHIVSKTAAFSP